MTRGGLPLSRCPAPPIGHLPAPPPSRRRMTGTSHEARRRSRAGARSRQRLNGTRRRRHGQHRKLLAPLTTFRPRRLVRSCSVRIAEQNAAMRRRRRHGAQRRDERSSPAPSAQRPGRLRSRARRIGAPRSTLLLKDLASGRRSRRTPTEGKRVTVLERVPPHLPGGCASWNCRAGPSASATACMSELRDQIELVWMTGELHWRRPRSSSEVAWGLHFFDETLFECCPECCTTLEDVARRVLPGRGTFEVPPSSSSVPGRRRPRRQPLRHRVGDARALQRNALAWPAPLPRAAARPRPHALADRALALPVPPRRRSNRAAGTAESGRRPRHRAAATPARPIPAVPHLHACASSMPASRATRAPPTSPDYPTPTG